MAVSFPAFAHRVTVFGSTPNNSATSRGVSKVSAGENLLKAMLLSKMFYLSGKSDLFVLIKQDGGLG